MAANLWARRGLLWQFAQREIAARNRGSMLGIFWVLLSPLIQLAIYTFVFAVVWEARWGEPSNSPARDKLTFALTLFCGLIVFDVFAATVNNASGAIVNQANLVKRVVFPLEVLPLAQLVASVTLLGVSLGVLLAANLALRGEFSATVWAFPLVLLPLVLLAGGVALLVSALGVFLRDMRQIVLVCVQVLFFMTPILYPIERLAKAPGWMRDVLVLNPLAPIFEGARATLLMGHSPDWKGLAIALVAGLVVLQIGYAVFMKAKRGFSDVL